MKINSEIVGDKKLTNKLDSIAENLLTREVMFRVTADASTFLKDRTLDGKDKNEKEFQKYSDTYLAFKKERGARFFKGRVNLFDQGDMLGAMQPFVRTSKAAEILFTRTTEALKASGHHKGNPRRGLPQREFFALGRKGRERATEKLRQHIGELVGS